MKSAPFGWGSQLFCMVIVATACTWSFAEETDSESKVPSEIAATTGASPSGSSGGSSSSSSAEHARVLKDFKKVDGLLPMHYKDNRLFFELSSKHYGGEYIVMIAIARGAGTYPLYGGFSWGFGDDWVWKFRKVGDRVHVIRKNVRFKANSGPESRAVKHAYNDSVLFSLPISTKGPGGGDLVEMTPVFMSDLPMVSQTISGFSFSPSKSVFGEVKGFEKNIELQVEATYASSGRVEIDSVPDSRGLSIDIHYSISKIPSTGYQPRLADDRIGYFLTAVKNFSKTSDDQFVRLINRWDLKKAVPSAKMSEPKEPIIFYLENTIPYKYRKPIRDGILEWNKAFEKAGFIDAIQVRQQEDDATWDPEDVRYNTFRWITSDAGFAMGPSRVNPYTGQILDADIIFDASFLEYWKQSFENYDPHLQESMLGGPIEVPDLKEFFSKKNRFASNQSCMLSNGMSQQLAFGAAALFADGDDDSDEGGDEEAESDDAKDKDEKKEDKDSKEDKEDTEKDGEKEDDKKSDAEDKKKREELLERMIMEGLKEVAMHEVGHTLGLRHNFVASKYRSLKEIANLDSSESTVASVMDYNPPFIAVEGDKQGAFYPETLGVYDLWAIEYGYKPFSGGTDGEKKELDKIASRSTEPGLAYLTDEDTTSVSPDPDANRFDLGSDALEYAKNQAEVVKNAMDGLADRVLEDGEDYSRVRQAFNTLLNAHGRAMFFASRYVGGVHVSRIHKGQENGKEPYTVVSAEEQREALKLLNEQIFSDKPFQFPPELYNQLAPSFWNHWGTNFDVRGDYPVIEYISAWQDSILSKLMSSTTLERLHDSELKVPADQDAFTTAELLEELTATIFAEVDNIKEGEFTNRKPAISTIRRNLQRSFFQRMARLAMGDQYAPADCQTIAFAELVDLKARIDKMLDSDVKLDSYSRAHLLEISSRIDKVLEAELTLRGA